MEREKTFRNERLTYRLNIVAEEAITANDAVFLRETGCRIRELRVLRLIDDTPGTTFAELARTTGFERSLTSRIIQSLLAAGLVVRENSPEDARVFLLRTTDKGREVRQVARRVSDRLERVLTQPLSREELERLDAMLDRLGRWVMSQDYQQAIEAAS